MVFLLGASGYVGRCFAEFLKGRKVEVMALSRAEHNYADPGSLKKLLRTYRPEFLINAAGFTGKPNVDACEKEKGETLFANTVLPLFIAEACAAEGIRWGHVSSGCVYQGAKGIDSSGNPIGFREEDPPNFDFHSGSCSFYSGTKAMAEEHLMKDRREVYIWRLRVPFDHRDNARNYLSKLMRYKTLLNVRNSLSHLGDVMASAWMTVERGLPPGIYNLTNPGSVTTAEVVELIFQERERRLAAGDDFSAQRMPKEVSYFASEEEFMNLAAIARRSSCVLDTTNAEKMGLPLRPVREAIADSLRRWVWEKSP
jgi:dTDP-4-dehydrorhamnose reductase